MRRSALLVVSSCVAFPVPVAGQPAPAPEPEEAPPQEEQPGVVVTDDGRTIVVTAPHQRGSVIGNVPPELQFGIEDIRALGAGDIGEAIDLLAPMAGVPAGEQPIVLLNGRRISSTDEIRRYPREALERVDILPPEVALSYGYPVGHRVMNFVVRERFYGGSGDLALGFATAGGRSQQEAKLSLLRIAGETRVALDASYRRDSLLLESERDIVQPEGPPFDDIGNVAAATPGDEIDPALSALAGRPVSVAGLPSPLDGAPSLADFAGTAGLPRVTDSGRYRSLLPATDRLSVQAQINLPLSANVSAGVIARFNASDSRSLIGPAPARIGLPASNPFSPFGRDVFLYRFLGELGPRSRLSSSRSAHLAVKLNGTLGTWRWNYDGTLDRNRSTTQTDAIADISAVQERIDAGDPSLNPFAPFDATVLARPDPDSSRSAATLLASRIFANGPLITLPAGPARLTVSANHRMRDVETETIRSGIAQVRETKRQQSRAQASINLPVASRRRDILAPIGDLSANFDIAVDRQSGSGALLTLRYGFNWSPVEGVMLGGLISTSEESLSEGQISDPIVETPNVRVFDFATGESVEVVRIEGGNPSLLAPRGRDMNFRVVISLLRQPSLTFNAFYRSERIRNLVGSFPNPAPEIEAAFPERFVRDAQGRLLRIDARPINFRSSKRANLGWGLSLSTPLGDSSGARRPANLIVAAPRRSPGGLVLAGSAPPGAARLNVSLRHSYQLRNQIVIRDGVPALDLLSGDSAGGTGQPRHTVNLLAMMIRKGWNFRLTGLWRSATSVRGGASELRFSDIATLNLSVGVDLGEQPKLVERYPWLEGVSVTLEADNLFDSRQRVRDAQGKTPLSFQPAYRDPLGRFVQLRLRKAF